MKHELRKFQRAGVNHAKEFFRTAGLRQRQMYSAPTGVGKSIVELELQREFPGLFIVTPRDEIVEGMLDKLDASGTDPESLGLWTPIKLRNRLLDGRVKHPRGFIIDEAHHETAETWQQLDLLTGEVPAVGYTATPYRGTPKGTREFRERWGECIPLITFEEAAKEGYIRVPEFHVLPLVDDDVVEVRAGDFAVESIEAATLDRLGDLAEHARRWHDGTFWDRATIFAVPSSALCVRLREELTRRGLPAAIVNAQTPKSERWAIFEAVEKRAIALLHINVVSEGVDLKLRRLVDLAPTMSPVKWVQQLGRITRPSERAPEYICCCRNILRHAYALEGAVPVSAIREGETKFGPSRRAQARVLGMEAIGRFKATRLKLTSGIHAEMYNLSAVVGRAVIEYCCIAHPTKEPIWAVKMNTVQNGVKTWGKWTKCQEPVDLKGFGSAPPNPPSERQLKWWMRSASSRGLDVNQEVTRKNFQAMPVLFDIGEVL